MADRIPLIIGIKYSPWTQRALWALDHHRVRYDFQEHLIMLGMPSLRLKTGRWSGDLTVPVLIDGNRTEWESFGIVHYGDEKGSGSKLIEGFDPSAIAECVADAEVAAETLRARWVAHVLAHPQAQIEALPPWIPGFLRPAMRPMARLGSRYIAKEFEIDHVDLQDREFQLRGVLNRMRWRLHKGAFSYVLDGRFSYADIVLCEALQAVKPVSDTFVRLSPSMREGATHEELAREFSDLVQWRDRVYQRHRLSPQV